MKSIMDTFTDLDTSQKVLYVFGGAVVAIVSVVGLRKLCFRERKAKDYPRDTVIHHQVDRGPYAPSMTPFAVKLETYLRMAKIPYQNVHGFQRSSKGKFTWIEYNGQEVADSSLCIEFLNKKLGVDLNRNLSPSDRGVAQAIQAMMEEHIYWFIGLFRWQYDCCDKSFVKNALKLSKILFWILQRRFKKQAWDQGLGRHTEEEGIEMLKKDLQSMSDFIGTKKFLMGDEPCETDCTVFAHLSQVYSQFTRTGYDNMLKDKYPNLAAYCERMKEVFWPDWDECITHGGTREATK
ncbi:failed axon connections homolog isoform X2 [Haliotis rubra]|uniref:failed axon connections homolog isoform X2 n=1 Tax=Haliotis rubra TaxID=36100 RepID=UPI001EE595A9|nr:failed axon connections homolog isoform X2 [Haliotis rubra]